MAKSIRSKRKRMFRNIKRQRYAVKELIRLKKQLGIPVTEPEAAVPPTNVIEYSLKSQPEVKEEPIEHDGLINYSFAPKGTLRLELSDSEDEINAEPQKEHKSPRGGDGAEEMEHSEKKLYDPTTMKDQFGKYPAWFTQKCIQKHMKKEKLRKRIAEKQNKLKEIADKKMQKIAAKQKKDKLRRIRKWEMKKKMKMEINSSEQQSINNDVEQNNDVVKIEN